MGIGVAGGRGLDGTKPYLGTLGIICQPYSFVEWSMNWDFLSAEFRPAPGKLKHNLNANLNASQFRWLNQILIDWYQILDGQTYLSPLSMQLCAPGYIMRGLGFRWLSYAPALPAARRSWRPSIILYITGITISEISPETMSPPMTTRASGAWVSPPSPQPSATGISAKVVVALVISTGRSRRRTATRTASMTVD